MRGPQPIYGHFLCLYILVFSKGYLHEVLLFEIKNYIDLLGNGAWRIIPVSKWLITMVIVSPLNGVVGPLINGLSMAYKWRLLTT